MTPPKPQPPPGYKITRYAVPTRRNCDAWMITRDTLVTWNVCEHGAYDGINAGRRWLLRRAGK